MELLRILEQVKAVEPINVSDITQWIATQYLIVLKDASDVDLVWIYVLWFLDFILICYTTVAFR